MVLVLLMILKHFDFGKANSNEMVHWRGETERENPQEMGVGVGAGRCSSRAQLVITSILE